MKYKLLVIVIVLSCGLCALERNIHYFSDNDSEQQIFLKIETFSDSVVAEFFYEYSYIELKGRSENNYYQLYSLDRETFLDLNFNDRTWNLQGEFYKNKKFEEIDLKQIAATFNKSQKLEKLEMTANFPFFYRMDEMKIVEDLNDLLLNSVQIRQQKFWKDALQEWQDHSEYTTGYCQQIDYDLEYFSSDLVSLLYTEYLFTGGAHGNTSLFGENYQFKNDVLQHLELEDIFDQNLDYQNFLQKICLIELRKQEASSVVDGTIKKLSESDLLVFSFNDNFFMIHFEPYRIGCYAEGSFTVKIPWQDLKSLIAQDSKFERFIK